MNLRAHLTLMEGQNLGLVLNLEADLLSLKEKQYLDPVLSLRIDLLSVSVKKAES